MKRITLITIMCLTACLKALSVEVEVDGIKYVANIEDKSAKVIRKDNKYEGSIVIPSSINVDGVVYHVTSIGEYAFSQCSNLISVTMPEGITTIEKDAFAACNHLSPVVIPSTVTSIGSDAFNGCSSFTSLTIPSSVKSIGYRAFRDCFRLTSITIPEGVTDIGHSAFIYCTGLSSVTIPSSVVHFGGETFRGCSHLTSVTIAEGATIIGEGDFEECFALASITIPSSVTTIGQSAFLECHNLADVYCKAEKVPATGAYVFDDIESLTLHVPASAIEEYKSTEPWSKFGTIVALDTPPTTYRPLAKEGKVWNYQRTLNSYPKTYQNYSYIIKGDTTINDKEYKKLYYRSSRFETYAGALRDENGKAYYVQLDSIQEKLYYDVTGQSGDRLDDTVYGYLPGMKVVENKIVEINGIPIRRITWRSSPIQSYYYWYEGIGSIEDKFLPKKFQQFSHELLSCIEDGVYIYGNKNSVPPNHYRRPIRFDYEAKDGLNHPKSKIWAENDNTSTGIYFENVTDSFKIYVNNNYFDAFGSAFIGSTFIEWGGTFARFPITITIESEYEKFCGQITERYEETDYRPFIEEGKVWKVGHTGDTWLDRALSLEYFYFDGDTIVDGRSCKKMMRREESPRFETTTTYIGALYEDNRCVYCALPNSTDFVLLYDFGSPIGTDFTYYASKAKVLTKGFIKERIISEDEKYHGRMTIIPYYDNSKQEFIDMDEVNVSWREGVGCKGFYNSTDYMGPVGTGLWELMSCTIGDEVLYFDPEIIDCVTPEDSEVKKNTIDFTHTVKTRPKAPRRGAVSESGDDEPLTGEYSLKELFVNFKPLAGPYVITICDDSGTEVYRKEVQTSNVIGLNTDISGYEKGEYTITVENEEEAYTAKLSIDEETAIQPLPLTPSPVSEGEAGAMYDLSGRRIANNSSARQLVHSSTLPKGIYIKDGRKVVVK